jgi:hypothetical protein
MVGCCDNGLNLVHFWFITGLKLVLKKASSGLILDKIVLVQNWLKSGLLFIDSWLK